MGKTISLFFLSLCLCWGANANDLQLQENAPERYIVVEKDTLWTIANQFLKEPWRWPELWKMNREQIKNPGLIYPGNVLILEKSTATLRLVGREVVKLSSKVRTEAQQTAAIPSIPTTVIEPFLSKPLIVDATTLELAARITALQETRVAVGTGDVVYVTGLGEAHGRDYQVFRPGKTLIDPETKELLGHEAFFLGDALVRKFGDPSTVDIIKAKQEIVAGDRLLPLPEATFPSYIPHAPEKEIQGRIISAYDSVVEVGHILATFRSRDEKIKDTSGKSTGNVVLPLERFGLLFVFRAFEKISYALVLQTTRPVVVSDVVQNP